MLWEWATAFLFKAEPESFKAESDLFKTESWQRTKCTHSQYKFAT